MRETGRQSRRAMHGDRVSLFGESPVAEGRKQEARDKQAANQSANATAPGNPQFSALI